MILVSTQNPTETQECIAHALGVPMNKIVCRVKRMGGGFGGKESRNIPISLVRSLFNAQIELYRAFCQRTICNNEKEF